MEELSPDSKYIDNQPFVPLERNSQALYSSGQNAIASQSNGRVHVEQGIAEEEYMLTLLSGTGSEPNVFQLTNSQRPQPCVPPSSVFNYGIPSSDVGRGLQTSRSLIVDDNISEVLYGNQSGFMSATSSSQNTYGFPSSNRLQICQIIPSTDVASSIPCSDCIGDWQSSQSYSCFLNNGPFGFLYNNEEEVGPSTGSSELDSGISRDHNWRSVHGFTNFLDQHDILCHEPHERRSMKQCVADDTGPDLHSNDHFDFTKLNKGLSSFALEDYITHITGNSLNHEGNSSESIQALSQETGQHSVQQEPKCSSFFAKQFDDYESYQVYKPNYANDAKSGNGSNFSDDEMMLATLIDQVLRNAGFEDHHGPEDILQSVPTRKCTSLSVTQSATQGSVSDPLEQFLDTSALWGYDTPDDSQGNCIHYDASLPCSHACQFSCSETDGWIPPCSCCLEVAQTSMSDE